MPRSCPHCGVEPDCLCHRLSTCEFEPAASARKELFDQEVVDAWAADGAWSFKLLLPQGLPRHNREAPNGCRLWLGGCEDPVSEVAFGKIRLDDGELFMDGSC